MDHRQNPLELLRTAHLDYEGDRAFEDRVMRRVRLEARPRFFQYWLPTIVGAATAAVALLALLQILSFAPQMEPIELDGIQVERTDSPDFPHRPQ